MCRKVAIWSALLLAMLACGQGPSPQGLRPPVPAAPRPAETPQAAAPGSPPPDRQRASPSLTPRASPSPTARPGVLLAFTEAFPVPPATESSIFDAQLYIWDEALRDSYAVPAAGKGMVTANMYLERQVLLTRADGRLLLFDLQSETLAEFPDVDHLGFILFAFATSDGRSIAITTNPDFAPVVDERARAFLWRDSTVSDLPALNAIAQDHRGVVWVRPSPDGRVLVAATGDGRIFLYPFESGVPGEVVEARQTGFAQMPTLSPGASRLAWIAGGERKHIYLMDLATASSPAGTVYRPVAAPRLLPEVTLTRTLAQFETAIFAPGENLYVVIKNIQFGTTDIFRYEYSLARIALLATLNLTRPHD